MNDLELLRRYARDGSEAAFSELSRRYVSLVYSAALRQVHRAADAEDVTQAVFLLLARKSRGLASKDVVVPAWLLKATHFVSRTHRRTNARRRAHETRAATMTTTGRSGGSDAGPDWEQVAPLLDEAIASLGDAARDAVVLRFLRGKSYRDVAERLAIEEPAARQRVSRAVEQLRAYFARRGVVLSASAIETAIVAHAVHPAPQALAVLAAKVGAKGAAIAAKHAALAQGAAFGMVPAGIKAGAAAAIIVVVGAASMALYTGVRDRQRATIDVASVSAAASVKQSTSTAPIRGRVLDPSGRPAAGAEVMLARFSSAVYVYGPAKPGVLVVSTASDGTFEFPAQPDATSIVVRSDEGFAQVRVADLQNGAPIQLVPWGRIEGTLKVGSTPQGGQIVALSRTGGSLEEWYAWRISHDTSTRSDSRGHFFFPRVIPLPRGSRNQLELNWQAPDGAGTRTIDLWVAPRETAHVELGGMGRPVTGRLAIPPGLPPFVGQLVAQPPASQPAGGAAPSPMIIPVAVSRDGAFRADDVPAGRYNLVFISTDPGQGRARVAESLAVANTSVTVPDMPGGRSDEPLDLGTLPVHRSAALAVGQAAPDFATPGPDSKPVRLSDFRGKYVLVYAHRPSGFEDPWINPQELNAIRDRFACRPDFVMLDVPIQVRRGSGASVMLEAVRSWLATHAGWSARTPATQPTTAPSAGLPPAYVSSAARLFLIGPDGKCVARILDTRTAFSRIADLLPRPVNPRIHVQVEHRDPNRGTIASLVGATDTNPSALNVARSARWSIVDGQLGDGSGGPGVLNDGRMATSDDERAANLFFSYGSLEGRFRMDLDAPAAIRQIITCSRHRTHRAPQVYAIYGSDGQARGFDPRPPIGVDPTTRAWTKIADVDTRPASGPDGGQYVVTLTATGPTPIGQFKHLLFVVFATEIDDDWGHTFYSEIAVLGQEGNP